jgi:integrase/recombinase XerD
VHRAELKLKEPETIPQPVSEQDFQHFVDSIHLENEPNAEPSGFRDRLICFMLKEGGFRLGALLGMRMDALEFGKQGVPVRFRPDNENGARAKAGSGRDRFVHLCDDVLGLLAVYLTEVWIEANPRTDHLWILLNKHARNREAEHRYGAALSLAAVESRFEHSAKKSGITIHPHLLRHSHATDLVRSYLKDGEPVDWKFVQERLGHASVVTTIQTSVHLSDEDRKHAYERYGEKRKKADAQREDSSPSCHV